MKFSEISDKLGNTAIHSLTTTPDCNPEITGVAPIDEAASGTLSYIEGEKFAGVVAKTAASALILPLDEALQKLATERGIAWIATTEPRLMFAQSIAIFYQPFKPVPEIHPTAVIDASATIGEDIYLGPHVVIHAGVTIGDRVCIH
ncbi:MAG: LpxD N-terminal domain-containing protein, partial [Microcystaceae cyanobacterium]